MPGGGEVGVGEDRRCESSFGRQKRLLSAPGAPCAPVPGEACCEAF